MVRDGIGCVRRIEGEQQERNCQKQHDNERRPVERGSLSRPGRGGRPGAQRAEREQDKECKNGRKKFRPEDACRPEPECGEGDNPEPRGGRTGEILPLRITPEAEQKETPPSYDVGDPSGEHPGPERLSEEHE